MCVDTYPCEKGHFNGDEEKTQMRGSISLSENDLSVFVGTPLCVVEIRRSCFCENGQRNRSL